ncbi:MAG: ATP-dependent Clp protease ATP-binding subunit [Myxococcales bacterium]|nr:ATP-dependent Clp protease ATP-binding subunit [Myxococcales bacterium]MCB9709282.1 ATP-dependent Clp protease ATP-binding subunit [Myxococcales bacterium]
MSTAHVLLAIVQRGGRASSVLAEEGIGEAKVAAFAKGPHEESDSCVEMCVQRATRVAATLGGQAPSELHLLLALIREPRSSAYRCIEKMGTSPAVVQQQALACLGKTALKQGTRVSAFEQKLKEPRGGATPSNAPLATERGPRAKSRPIKEGPDCPAPRVHVQARIGASNQRKSGPSVKNGPLGHVVWELDPMVYPMLHKLGRNLSEEAALGRLEPVIGRDVEVETLLDVLARRRANNPVLVGPPGVGKTAIVEGLAWRLVQPDSQRPEVRIIEVSVGSLLSGTGVRGALSERVRSLIDELITGQGDLILFIDEIHGVLGGLEGVEEISTELKTALGRARFRCIGTTTDREYSRRIERDPALMRRFQRVQVEEPSEAASKAILRGALGHYESYHSVSYAASAVDDAVTLAARFIHERHLPDKAISVLDMAGARAKRRGAQSVSSEDIAQVISEQSKIPVDRLLSTDAALLLGLEQHLRRRIVGQDDVVETIASTLRKSAAGFRGRGPLGVFLALGPTGVGKTAMAKAVSALLFPGSETTRIDMSEFSEPHSIARLLGAPPGYIGHEDGGQLTEAVRQRPYQLILLDEVDKAHRDVLLALLPLLDEGRLTDARGRTVDFTHTVVMMTSNFGSDVFLTPRSIGFMQEDANNGMSLKTLAMQATRKALPPELWNRIDEPLVFMPLEREAVIEIANRSLSQLAESMKKTHRIQVTFGPAVVDFLLASGGYDTKLGARPLARAVGRLVEAPLAEAMLSKRIESGDHVDVGVVAGKLRIHVPPKRPALRA